MKKTICLILSLILLSANISAAAQQPYSQEDGYVIVDHVVYALDNNLYPNTYKVVSLFDTDAAAQSVSDVKVVGDIGGIPVKSVQMHSNSGIFTAAKSIELPDSIEYIASADFTRGPFAGLINVEKISIPKNLKLLGDRAFEGLYGLKGKIVLPESVTSVGERAFAGCRSLEEVEFKSKTLTYIPSDCFNGCENLSRVIFRGKLKAIGDYAFSGCKNFSAFRSVTELKLPSTLISIGEEAFAGTGVTAVTIPRSVTKYRGKKNRGYNIGAYAFKDCKSLKTAVIKGGKRNNIYLCGTFSGCEKLKSVTLPQYAKSITVSEGTFKNCKNLGKIVIKNAEKAPAFKLFERGTVYDRPIEYTPFRNTRTGIRFYTKNQKVAKQLKKNLTKYKRLGVKKAKIYAGKKLVYKNVSSNKR